MSWRLFAISGGFIGLAFSPALGHSDFSGIPLSSRRAYGRILATPFQCQRASIKKLNVIQSKDAKGNVRSEVRLYVLTLSDTTGDSALIYFTQSSTKSIQSYDSRVRPTLRESKEFKDALIRNGGVPFGITSIQYISHETGKPVMFREKFSGRLALGKKSDGKLGGSLIIVFPDAKRSFISGAFKADLVGF